MNLTKNGILIFLLLAGQTGLASQNNKTSKQSVNNSREQKYSAEQEATTLEQAKKELYASLKKHTHKSFDLCVDNLKKRHVKLDKMFSAMVTRAHNFGLTYLHEDIEDLHGILIDWSKKKCTNKTASLLAKLIDNGFDIYASGMMRTYDNENNQARCHSLMNCATHGESNVHLLKAIINCKKINLNKADKNGETPLLFAIKRSNDLATKLLIDARVNINGEDGDSPLLCALKYCNHHATKLLIDAGVNVNGEDGNTLKPIICALKQRQLFGDVFHSVFNEEWEKDIRLLIEKGAEIEDRRKIESYRIGDGDGDDIYCKLIAMRAPLTSAITEELLQYLISDLTPIVLEYAGHKEHVIATK